MRNKHKKKDSISVMSEVLQNEEQRAKFDLKQESLDYKGIVRTNKLANQTIYDIMLVHEHINQSEHEAVFIFVQQLADSGANVASSNLEGLSHAPAYTVGGNLSDKRMSFSDAYREVKDKCGKQEADQLVKLTNDLYSFPALKKDQKDHVQKLSLLVRPALVVLSKFYGVDKKRDPRDILRSQVGAFRENYVRRKGDVIR